MAGRRSRELEVELGTALMNVIRGRRTIHSYLREEVPLPILTKALELALWSPNHKLTFPWQFIHLGPNARAQLAELGKPVSREKYLKEGSIVLFAMKKNEDPVLSREDYATMACAVQNFSLYLWAEGFGTKWSSGGIIRDPKIFELAGVNAAEYEIVGLIWAGKFSQNPPPQRRPSIEERLRHTD